MTNLVCNLRLDYSLRAFKLALTMILLFWLSPLFSQTLEEAKILTRQGSLLLEKGQYKEALPFFERDLSIREKLFGPQHPAVAWSLDQVSGIYQELHEYNKALEFSKQALSIYEKSPGITQPQVAGCLYNLGSIYFEKGDFNNSITTIERALEI